MTKQNATKKKIGKKRKSQPFSEIKIKKRILSTIYCNQCRDNIPVQEGSKPLVVLGSHIGRCKGHKVSRSFKLETETESDVVDASHDDMVDEGVSHDDVVYKDTFHDAIVPGPTFTRCSNVAYFKFQEKLEQTYKSNLKINKQANWKKSSESKRHFGYF